MATHSVIEDRLQQFDINELCSGIDFQLNLDLILMDECDGNDALVHTRVEVTSSFQNLLMRFIILLHLSFISFTMNLGVSEGEKNSL